ncbi:hypothetical protein BH20GEM1_BH20GEM1_01380 [soil metagenome]
MNGLIEIRHPRYVVSSYAEGSETPFRQDGWFLTGDQGHFDNDGYLILTGRRDDLINRGGVKVSPAEVEQVLLEYPDVSEAVVFPVPHLRLGEEVAAIVVPGADRSVDIDLLRRFALGRLPESKAPRRILVMKALPRGVTGKIHRRELVHIVGSETEWREPIPVQVDPRALTCVRSAWGEILGHPPGSGLEDFFAEEGIRFSRHGS